MTTSDEQDLLQNFWGQSLNRIAISAERKARTNPGVSLEESAAQQGSQATQADEAESTEDDGKAAMHFRVVRYTTRSDAADDNEHKVVAVLQELHQRRPEGLKYLVLRLHDGEFLHLAVMADGAFPLTQLESFGNFRDSGPDRWLGPPASAAAKLVGSYGFDLPKDDFTARHPPSV